MNSNDTTITPAPDNAPSTASRGVDLHVHRPHPARMYDYLLGGKDNFPADRTAADTAISVFPQLETAARENRAFMTRAARHLAAKAGIRQFLDVGTGFPTTPNLHETVQTIAPDARVVYTDNDPLVLVHARALLTSTPAGRTAYLDADLRDVETILTAPELHDTLDLTRPVALSLVAVLHFLSEQDDPYGLVRRLLDPLPAGSHLLLSHITADVNPAVETAARVYRQEGVAVYTRTYEQIAGFFDGLELVDPGLVSVHRWRPDPTTTTQDTTADRDETAKVDHKADSTIEAD
ncbi:SAM-dependent methyltransferase [Candidatus Frankia nodulisporulans]|uniref:SAM-dependent methyltransferase n=1 Tax=Candidatus Frankia nodulisporulans TaxID=2060052 RepID=UPI0013CFA085|nr:SAM-dependent methyltransferase [Candidatus Frankia nodulisporulans]